MTPLDIERLREALEHSTQGKWRKGISTHHTVCDLPRSTTKNGYRIAEFHHADDAHFCDVAHELMPQVLEALDRLPDNVDAGGQGSASYHVADPQRHRGIVNNAIVRDLRELSHNPVLAQSECETIYRAIRALGGAP